MNVKMPGDEDNFDAEIQRLANLKKLGASENFYFDWKNLRIDLIDKMRRVAEKFQNDENVRFDVSESRDDGFTLHALKTFGGEFELKYAPASEKQTVAVYSSFYPNGINGRHYRLHKLAEDFDKQVVQFVSSARDA